MKHKKLIGIVATSALLLGSVATFAACGGNAHTIERVDEKQATCIEGGHAAYYKCTDEGCDKLFSDIKGEHEITWDDVEKTDPLGHDMKHVDAKAATCTEEGTNDHYHCDRCELNFTDEAGSAEKTDAVINALGHDMEEVAKQIPVTGQPGVKAHYRCKRENAEYFDSFGDKKVTDENKHELEYNMLAGSNVGWSYDADYSHSNDADPYITIPSGNSINAATSEYYTDIAYTARIQKANVNKQFVFLAFENKGIYSISLQDGKIRCDDSMSGWDCGPNQGYTYLNDAWDGYTLSAGEQDSYEGDGLEVTLARTGKTVKVFVNGREVHSATLAGEYETEPVKGAMIVWNAIPNVKYYFHAEPQTPTAAAPKVTVAAVDAAQGAVTLNKDANAYAYGDELVITIAPTEEYVFDKLIVNGRDVSSLVSNGTYTTNTVNISVVFKVKEFGSVNADVTGRKHGVTDNSIADNAAYELVGIGESYSGALTGGRLVVDSAVTGEYTLKIEGYFDAKITIEKDAAYTTAIALEYDLLHANNVAPYGLTTDLSHQNDGSSYIAVTNGGGHVNIFTAARYDDVMFSATFKAGNSWRERKGIMLAFSDKKGVQIGFDSFDENNKENVTLYFWGAMKKDDAAQVGANEKYIFESTDRLCANVRLDSCNPITGELYNKYKTTGLKLSVGRDGTKILVLLDGKTVGGVTVDEGYADDTVVVGVFTEWAEPHQIPFELSETLPDFATPTFTLTQGENGTVTKTSNDTYSVWEPITLTITPASNYRLKQLTVNGVVLTGNKTEYSFYPVAGENTVVPVFEQIPFGSIDAAVTGNKHGVTGNAIANGTSVDLIGSDNVEYHLTVTDGKIALTNVVAGKYTVKVAGYLDGSITVPEGTAYETAIVLEYNFMKGTGWYDNQQDLSHMNDADAYITLKADAADSMINVSTVNGYDEVAITVTFGKDMRGDNNFAGPAFLFGNKYLLIIVQKDNKASEFSGYRSYWELNCVAPDEWKSVKMTDEEWTAYENNTLALTLVRKGGSVYVFVGNTPRMKKDLPADLATQKAHAGIMVDGTVKGENPAKWRFKVEEDITEYLTALPATLSLNMPENGTVSASKTEGVLLYDEITLTLAPATGYHVKSITLNGSALPITDDVYISNTIKFTVAAKVNEVVIVYEAITTGNVTFTADEKWNANGLVVTFKRGTETKTVTLGDNATIENMAMDVWTATTVVGNMTVSLGDVFIDSENFTLDLAKIFNDPALVNKRVTSANLANNSIVYKTDPDDAHTKLWLNTENLASGDAYFMTKLSLSDADKAAMSSSNKHMIFSVAFRIGGKERYAMLWWKHDEGNFKFIWADNSDIPDAAENAFIAGDGMYIVWQYEASSGKIKCYVGTSADNVTYLCEAGAGDDLATDGTVTAIGFTEGLGWGGQSWSPTVEFRYGTTLNEALGITE